ncbi:MAG: site-specific integrase [Saccharothrix sp.]|nr:site-specific integrase [Saccharothrix sp.]
MRRHVPSTGEAIEEFLVDLAGRRQREARTSPRTVRSYGTALRVLLDSDTTLAILDTPAGARRLRAAFTDRWGTGSPATWNARRSAYVSAVAYWTGRGWLTTDPLDGLAARPVPSSPSRARPRLRIDKLLTDQRHPLRERCLWTMLYSTAARAEEILALDVRDLDLPDVDGVNLDDPEQVARLGGTGHVRRKGGRTDEVTWDGWTTLLILALLDGRTSGPLFLATDRTGGRAKPRRLSYRQALDLFEAASRGWTFHDLRHSALTHRSEDGMPTPMLMTKSGHRDIRSLARYARPSVEAVRRWEDEHAARRR